MRAWSSRAGGLCITDGASECQGQAVHFFAVSVCAIQAWERRTCIVIRGTVVCSPPKHDRGVLARGYRANLSNSLQFLFFFIIIYFPSLLLCFRFFPLFFIAFDVYAREREREREREIERGGNKR